MAITNLNRLSVPLAGGGQSTVNQGLLMPKLKYRFRVLFNGFGVTKTGTTELTKQVVTAGRPNLTFDQVELHVYNSRVKYAGKHTWEDVQIVVRDDASGNVSKMIGEQLQKQFDFFEQASASAGTNYKFTTEIQLLDGGNGTGQSAAHVLESFVLQGCYLKQVQYQQGDYSSSDPMDATLTIAYDNALQYNGDKADMLNGADNIINRTLGTLATGGAGG